MYYNLTWTLILTTRTYLNYLPSIELHVPDTTNTIIIIGVNENNVEESDAESSSMDNDKYRIHMDGDNIYVIYASPSQSSNPVKIADSSILEIDTSPINQFEQQQKSSSFSSFLPYGYKLPGVNILQKE